MKIIDVRTGKLQVIPFTLGEAGRGRHAEEIKLSNRPDQAPSGPDDVSYFTFGAGEGRHCILTRGDDRRGVLLRVNTRGAYTRGSCGRISLVGGQATCIASGRWAEGAAGAVASGSDQLWHAEGPALFEVVLQGGESKGMGLRYLVIGRSMVPRLIAPSELVQLIATDGDPDVTETVRAHVALIGTVGGDSARGDTRREEIASAIRLADQLEDHVPSTGSTVAHYSQGDIRACVTSHGIAIPVIYADDIGGVSGVQAGTLVPGTLPLAAVTVGPGGGKRYSYEMVAETGVRRLAADSPRPYTSERVLYLVETSAWMVAWVSRRDGADTAYTIAGPGGIHTYMPSCSDASDDGMRAQEWPGLPVGARPDFEAMFPVLQYGVVPPPAQAQVADLIARVPQSSVSSSEIAPRIPEIVPPPARVADLIARFNKR